MAACCPGDVLVVPSSTVWPPLLREATDIADERPKKGGALTRGQRASP